jgi:hypothetical protein
MIFKLPTRKYRFRNLLDVAEVLILTGHLKRFCVASDRDELCVGRWTRNGAIELRDELAEEFEDETMYVVDNWLDRELRPGQIWREHHRADA